MKLHLELSVEFGLHNFWVVYIKNKCDSSVTLIEFIDFRTSWTLLHTFVLTEGGPTECRLTEKQFPNA